MASIQTKYLYDKAGKLKWRTYSYFKAIFGFVPALPVFLRPTNFCIWHSGRCGSTVLASMLKQHPKIYCAEELLETYSKSYESWADKSGGWSGGKWRIRRSMQKGGTKVSGFEMKIWHLHRLRVSVSEAMNFLRGINFNRHIVLERQNYLRVIVSGHILRKTSRSHIKLDESTPNLSKVYINLEELDSSICKFSDFYTELKMLLGQDCLWLLYEKDILEEPNIAFRKVTDFLGLEPLTATVRLRRTNPYPLQEIILNFDEISAHLKDTTHEWMLEN